MFRHVIRYVDDNDDLYDFVDTLFDVLFDRA